VPYVTVDGHKYEFSEATMTNLECMAIEDAMGVTVGEWQDLLNRRSMKATTALVWTLRRREEPGLKFEEVVFNPASIDFDSSDEDAAEGKEPDPSSPDTVTT